MIKTKRQQMVKTTNYKDSISQALKKINTNSPFYLTSLVALSSKLYRKSMNYSFKRFKYYLRRAVESMVDSKSLIRVRNSFRLSAKAVKKLAVANTKKGKFSTKTKQNNNNQNLPSKRLPILKITTKAFPKSLLIPIGLAPNNSNSASKKIYEATWQYHDSVKFGHQNSNHWFNYDSKASNIVEDEWQRYIINRGMNDVREVKSGEWSYMVDFVNWKQTNVEHPNHKTRSIRRLDSNNKVTNNPYN